MDKKKVFLLIPLVIVAMLISYCWVTIVTTDLVATWRHLLGLALFTVLVIYFLKSRIKATVLTGIYLLLGTANLLAVTATVNTSWITIGPISTPPVQMLFLGLLVLYFFLNMNSLFDIYLDYKEGKKTNV